ncbi:hypothetical protein M8J77_002193 [Diaphorina citri]|nr:hypothetical protein M8J77_002193 [Diaphorina citri]
MSRSCVPAIPCPAWKVLIPALQPRMRELSVWRTLWRRSSRSFKELGTKSSWTRIPSLGPRPPLGYFLTLKNGSPPSLFAESEVEDVSVEPDFSFAFGPSTKEMEPAIPPPAPEIEALGIECQRLNSSGWSKIPFAEAQKEIQASGVFGRLKANPEIERRPSAKDDILAKMDGTLGCITHGLLLQRKYLEESMKWKKLGAPEGVINVLRGYAIPFFSRPPILPLRNPSGAIRQTPISAQMDLQVQKLLEHRVLVPNPFVSGFTSPPFLVPKGDGSKRPIIN